ncbi:MAG TPA: helix-turn-helix domain-containing protein [Chloroflexota bacterium]|nr:helix-turn-helix domain-containing protein [Chloroflexota bacterium]
MLRAHKIRLNPTPEQEVYFRKAAGTARFAYNWGLAEIKRALDEGRRPDSVLTLKQRFNSIKGSQFPWVYEVTKCAPEGAFRNLGAALTNFRASQRGERKGQVCPQCGGLVDRDYNAAQNLRDEALRVSAIPVVATSGC